MNGKRKARRIVLTCGMIMLTSLIGLPHNIPAPTSYVPKDVAIASEILEAFGPMEAYAAELYSDNWKMDSGGTWHYYMSDGSMCTNAWIEDHGQWYLLDSAGNMLTGVVKSNGGKLYLLDTVRGTGTYGKLLKSGVYQGVTINAVQSGENEGELSAETVSALRNAGVAVDNVVNVSNTKHVSNGVVTNENKGEQSSPGGQTGGSVTQSNSSEQAVNSKYANMSDSELTRLGYAGDEAAWDEYDRRVAERGNTTGSGYSSKRQDWVAEGVVIH